jgi:hypothetical protein
MLIKLSRTDKEIEELIYTLEIAVKELPSHAHPVHYERLDRLIEDLKVTYNKQI